MAAAALGIGAALCWGFADFLGGIRTKALTLALVLLVSQFTGLAAIAIVVAVGGFETPAFEEVAPRDRRRGRAARRDRAPSTGPWRSAP